MKETTGKDRSRRHNKEQKQSTCIWEKQTLFIVPCDSINETCLKKQVSIWQQTITDEVLIVPHCHTMAHTQRAQHLQHLEHNLSALDPATAQEKPNTTKTAIKAKILVPEILHL